MDKFSVYVIGAYVVTFAVLIGYLLWLWWRMRQEAQLSREDGDQR